MSNPININYEPLVAMSHAWGKAFRASLHSKYLPIVLVAFAAGIGLTVVGLVQVLIFVVFFYFLGLGIWVKRYKNKIWEEFASSNGWPLDTTTPQQALTPLSLQYGHSQRFSPVIQSQLGIVNADLFVYDCTTGGGKSQQTHSFTVARVPLSASLPHMVLLSKKAHADMRQDLPNHEKLQLEGDFNNYFTLQVEKGQEVDALAIISPDVMQTLVTYDNAEDIEIAGTDLYFILRSDKRDYTHMQQLIKSVMELSGQIIEHIKLTSVAAPAPAVVHPTVQASQVAQPPTTPVPPVPPQAPAAG